LLLLVVALETEHHHDALLLLPQHLVNEAMLDVDAAGAGAAQFPDQGLLGRRLDVGVVG
jgi:hypothetical protein